MSLQPLNNDSASPPSETSRSPGNSRRHVRRALLPIIDRRFQFKVTLLVVCIITLTHLGFGMWIYIHVADFAQKLADYVPDLAPDAHWIETEVMKQMIVTVITTFLAIFFLSIYFSARVSGPLFNMTRVLRQVAKGELHRRVKLRKYDELKEFSEALNHFLTVIEERENHLQEQVSQLQESMNKGQNSPKTQEILEKLKNNRYSENFPS